MLALTGGGGGEGRFHVFKSINIILMKSLSLEKINITHDAIP